MRTWVAALAFMSLAGCDNDPIYSDITQMCIPPTANGVALPTTAPLHVYPNAQETTILGPEPSYAILSDGIGGYRLEWTNPGGTDSICFSGLVTTAAALGTTITPDDSIETVVFNNPMQIGFAAVESTAIEGFNFTAGTQQVDLEVYVDGAAGTYVFYTDDATGLSTSVQDNVAAFISP